ncbi:MAG: ABC transporter ATP-binding protein [Haloarculaceae archaeon]
MATIRAEDVRRAYGDAVALDGVSLTVDAGEVFALVGPNGAGKTTLVRTLTGTTDADGSVSVFGSDPRDVDPERVGLLPQDFDPPERLTARELVEYYGGLYDDARPAEAVLADVGMADDADAWYENLSGGQQRRTCVATALVNDPDLLVLDEPTTGIDPAGRRALWRLVEDRAAAGTTVFLTTHYMAEAHRLGDRVGLLSDGRLVAVDDPAALVAEHGGESRLVVEVDAGAETADSDEGGDTPAPGVEAGTDSAPAALADLDVGYPTDLSDGRLTVYGVEPQDIGAVVDALDDAGARYGSLAWTEPDLEDVYLELTGERERVAGGRGRRSADAALEGQQ